MVRLELKPWLPPHASEPIYHLRTPTSQSSRRPQPQWMVGSHQGNRYSSKMSGDYSSKRESRYDARRNTRTDFRGPTNNRKPGGITTNNSRRQGGMTVSSSNVWGNYTDNMSRQASSSNTLMLLKSPVGRERIVTVGEVCTSMNQVSHVTRTKAEKFGAFHKLQCRIRRLRHKLKF